MVFLAKKKTNKVFAERVATGSLITVPIGTAGLNTKDALTEMQPNDAIILQNMIVENDRLVSRKGSLTVATGITGNVESIFEFSSASANKIISCAGGDIYVGLGGAFPLVGAPVVVGSGFTSDRWQGLMMNNYLLLFNGADTPQKYDGTTLSNNVFTGTSLTPTNLVGATNFKNKLIIWENNACGFWYGGSDAISGALEYFDLSFITKRGGYVVSCATWSFDSSGGTGLQARLVIFLSTGEAIVYEGTDPGEATDWSIVGRFKVAPPISQRAVLEYSGDVLLINKYDLISFSQVFATGENPDTQSKLVGAIASAVASYGSNFGWQIINHPLSALIIINVPTGNDLFVQYVINTRSGGASKFTGFNAFCFAVFDDNLYFGSEDKIIQALTGFADNGEAINIDVQTSFSNFGVNREKYLNYIKPYIEIDNDVNFSYSLNYDFQSNNLANASLQSNEGVYWDTVLWDTSFWSSESEIKSVQYGVSGQGIYVSFRLKAAINNIAIALYSILYSYGISKL